MSKEKELPEKTVSVTRTQRNIPWAFLVFLVLIVLINITLFAPYLMAIYFGWVISTVLAPLQARLLKKKWKAERAAILGTFVALFTMVIPIVGFGIALVKNLIRVLGPYAKNGVNIDVWTARVYSWPLVNRFFENQEEMNAFVDENSKKLIAKIADALSATLASTPEMALQLILALLAAYFILVDGKKLREWMSPRIPLPPKTKAEFVRGLNDTAYSSFLSMLAAATAQSLVVFIGFLVLGVPLAPLALGIAFVCAWFPIFGVTPVWVAGLAYLLASDHYAAAGVMLGVGIFAGIIDNIVRPWILKGRSDMHPLVSLVSIFGGIAYLGIPGVLVGPVVTSFGIEFLRVWPIFANEIGLSPESGGQA